MRKFVSKLPTKEIDFMGDKITIRKISAGAVKRISMASKNIAEDDEASLQVLLAILNEGVVFDEQDEALTVELLEEFPLDDLNKLSMAIMGYGGVPVGEEAGNAL